MPLALQNFAPLDAIVGNKQFSLPCGSAENPVAVTHRLRGVLVRLTLPLDAIRGKIGRPGTDCDKPIFRPDNAIEVFALFTKFPIGPRQSIGAAHAQTVQANSDKDVFAKGDINERVDRFHLRGIFPGLAIFRGRASATVADADKSFIPKRGATEDILPDDLRRFAPRFALLGETDKGFGTADAAGVAAERHEVAVAEGDNAIEGLGNGRMTRWEKYFEVWEQMPPIHHFVGVSFSGFKEAPVMMSLGMHSDYVRNLFLTGIIGVLCYIVFLFSIVYKGFMMRDFGDKFLIISSAFMIIMYSLSTMPTLYAPFLYIVYCIWAYALLPKEKQN